MKLNIFAKNSFKLNISVETVKIYHQNFSYSAINNYLYLDRWVVAIDSSVFLLFKNENIARDVYENILDEVEGSQDVANIYIPNDEDVRILNTSYLYLYDIKRECPDEADELERKIKEIKEAYKKDQLKDEEESSSSWFTENSIPRTILGWVLGAATASLIIKLFLE